MPHKHKRRGEVDKSSYDLPPSSRAKPLPSFNKQKSVMATDSKPRRVKQKAKLRSKDDDTPRAFARLMQFQKTGKSTPSGLDNGGREKKSKKRKRATEDSGTTPDPQSVAPSKATTSNPAAPSLNPGERLSDFNLRVDQALPLSMPRHTSTPQSKSNIPGLKERSTKHNRRLLRMQSHWREEEQRRKEKQEEIDDELEDEREETGLLWDGVGSNKRRKKGKKNTASGVDEDGEDIWAGVAKSREGTKQKNLQDVVQAPPQLKKVKSKFKLQGDGAAVDVLNVPGSVGSLRKREQMGAARKAVIDGYRGMMGKHRQLQRTQQISI